MTKKSVQYIKWVKRLLTISKLDAYFENKGESRNTGIESTQVNE